MSNHPAPSTPPTLFEQRVMSTTELRQFNDVFDQLNAQPYTAIRVERYGDVGAFLISPKLMNMFELAAKGALRVFRLSVDLGPRQSEELYKQVIVTERPVTDAPYQSWDVLVDSMPYTLSIPIDMGDEERLRPRANQVLWRHHPDVVRVILEEFPWTPDHDRAFNLAQQQSFGDTSSSRAFIQAAIDTMCIDEDVLSIDDPRDVGMSVASKEFKSLHELVKWLAMIGEEEFEADAPRDAGPGGGALLGYPNEDFEEIALTLLASSYYEALKEASFDVTELDDWR